MHIEDMHFDFKMKFNKVDSAQNKNLLIPEIDWALNEAQNIFLDNVAEPRIKNEFGFEKIQRHIDDIKTLVVTDESIDVTNKGDDAYILTLPEKYRFYLRARAFISKDTCKDKKAVVYVERHNNEFDFDSFNGSSFEWREVNALFTGEGIKLFTDNSFTIDKVNLSYIRDPKRIHFASGFRGGKYSLPSGEMLEGKQDCELPKHVHREVVDLAVVVMAIEMQLSDLQIKQAKLAMNQLS